MASVRRENRTEFKWFTTSEYKKEEVYLSEMHARGWKLTGITFPGFYHFTKCEPEEVRYQLDYSLEGQRHKYEYVRVFEDCGWEYLMDFVGFSYFRKPVADMCNKDEEIFSDEQSRVEMMKNIVLMVYLRLKRAL